MCTRVFIANCIGLRASLRKILATTGRLAETTQGSVTGTTQSSVSETTQSSVAATGTAQSSVARASALANVAETGATHGPHDSG